MRIADNHLIVKFIENDDVDGLKKYLVSNSIEVICMCGYVMRSYVEKTISALKDNNTVTQIELIRHSINDDGVKALASALKVNASVTMIDLSHNFIGDDGVTALASALKVNTSVTSIDLSCNTISNVGGAAILSALKDNNTVNAIDLSRNVDPINLSSNNIREARVEVRELARDIASTKVCTASTDQILHRFKGLTQDGMDNLLTLLKEDVIHAPEIAGDSVDDTGEM